MSSRKCHSVAEAELAAEPSGAREAEVSKAARKCLTSGVAGPGSEAAAMWLHMADAKLATVPRPVEQVELPGRKAFEQTSERERPERSVRTRAAVEPELVWIAHVGLPLPMPSKKDEQEGLDILPPWNP